MSWEHDDLGVAPEVDALATVFDRDFGFGVSQIVIPVTNPLFQLTHALLDWVESHGGDGSLLILYYAGHGLISDSGRTLIWTNRRCQDDPSYRELKWNGCEDILLQAAADKLFIFDCCYAANAVSTGGRGISEVICASGFESIAPLPGPHSFTTALISVLRRKAEQAHPFSVSTVYSGILDYLKALDPSQITPDGYRIANALDYVNVLPGLRRPEFRRTPVHFMRENPRHRHQNFGIQLFALPRPPTDGFIILHEKPQARKQLQAFTVKIRPAPGLSSADADAARRWLRSIPMAVEDISVDLGPPSPRSNPSVSSAEKEGHVMVPPGFDLRRTTHDLKAMKLTQERMREIVRITKQETESMHIISVLTLLFLPGTFVASLFSAGILNIGLDSGLMVDEAAFPSQPLVLIPSFTGFVILFWLLARWLASRGRLRIAWDPDLKMA
ncbi:hypothetical protein OQA88_8155 [Cercophora sp. LCS_1]